MNEMLSLFRITPSRGFVHTVISAFEGHNNLKISPDDIWTTILIQFSLFVNANAEQLRHHFVKHEGQKSFALSFCFPSNYTR